MLTIDSERGLGEKAVPFHSTLLDDSFMSLFNSSFDMLPLFVTSVPHEVSIPNDTEPKPTLTPNEPVSDLELEKLFDMDFWLVVSSLL